MPAHEAAGDLEIFLRSFLASFQHAADARRIHRERFFHEDMHALLHRVFQVNGAEARGRGQQHHVAFAEGINGLLESVQADELAFRGHVQLLFVVPFQVGEAGLEAMVEDVGHGPQFGWALGGKGLGGGAGAASAAADQGDLNGVVLSGVAGAGEGAGERGTGNGGAGGFEELATSGQV